MRRLAASAAALLSLVVVAGTAGAQSAPDQSLPEQRHDIAVRLDPASGELRVRDRFRVKPFTDLAFPLARWLTIEAARVDGRAVAPRRDGPLWRIDSPFERSGEVELELRGRIPPLADASGGAVSGAEGVYLPGSAAWIADVDEAPLRYRLEVEVPAPYRVVATGRLVEEGAGGTGYRAAFAAEHLGELPSLFAGPYAIKESRDADLRLRTYFHSELTDLADGYLDAAGSYIRRYAELIGPYPYADFHVISAPLPVGLGFPNLTYVGRMVLPLPFMKGRSLAHEVLHNWWGNGVGVDYARGNWAEGLTTYMADYALTAEASAQEAREMRLGWLRDFAALPPDQDMAVTGFTSKRHDAGQIVGYNKVAFIFHMVRREIGEAAFRAALRSFWSEQRFRVAGWPELGRAFERAAGRDLVWFFGQWLHRPGAPRIELAAARRRPGGGGVVLTLRQEAPAYRMRLPVVIDTDRGPQISEVVMTDREQSFEIAAVGEASAVHVDPDFDAFRRLLPGEAPPIFREVTLSEETVLVVATPAAGIETAARRLAERLLPRAPAPLPRGAALPNAPALVVGTPADVAAARTAAGLGEPAGIAREGTARAWIERRPGGAPVMFVSGSDAAALEAAIRALPHYRSRSYIVFEDARAARTGIWPAHDSPLSRRIGG